METCPDCDFCEVLPDGNIFCCLHDEQVHSGQTCRDWQSETRLIDNDNWFGVIEWPV